MALAIIDAKGREVKSRSPFSEIRPALSCHRL
jgi:hypothetical protein